MALNKPIANDTKESYRFPPLVSFYLSHVYTYASNIKLYMFTNLRLATW